MLDFIDGEGQDAAWEEHPGEDVHDGLTFERFNEQVGDHPRSCINYDPSHLILQCLDYLAFIDIYHTRIRAFHAKDAEFRPTGRCGVYGGYAPWAQRAGRFRSLGDGQVDFKAIFSKFTQYGCKLVAVLEWECCLKDSDQGAREGAPFIDSCLIRPPARPFDDFAGVKTDTAKLRQLMGLPPVEVPVETT